MTIDDMLTDLSPIREAIRKAITPSNPPKILDWVRDNYRLSSQDSAISGKISLDPWQAEVLATLDNPKIRSVVLCASSQIGKTVLGLAFLNYCAIHRPGPFLYLVENDEAAAAFAKDRIRPSISANATADTLLDRREGGGQTVKRFEWQSGTIANIVGAQAASNISSKPILSLAATEVRGFPLSAQGNGDPLSLAAARTKSFASRSKMFIESSPGILNRCRLTAEAQRGDCRKYQLPCPHCGHAAPCEFDPTPECHQVSYNPKDTTDAGIMCIGCGTIWTPQDRLTAIRNGFFKATKTPDDPTVASFFYSEIESPRSTIKSIVDRYLAARADRTLMQAFQNTVIGKCFDPDSQETRFDPSKISARAENYSAAAMLPSERCLCITAGIDVQDDRAEMSIVGHGESGERWLLDHLIFKGNPAGTDLYKALTDYLTTTTYRHPYGGSLKIYAACIDSGGHFTQRVYDYSAEQQQKGQRIFAVKGIANSARNQREIVAKSRSTKLNPDQPFSLLLVGVDTAKLEIFAALENTVEGPAYIHFPTSFAESYFRGLTSERLRYKLDKRGYLAREFVRHDHKVGNEVLDCLVYSIAALHSIHPAPDFGEIKARLLTANINKPRETMAETAARLARATGATPR